MHPQNQCIRSWSGSKALGRQVNPIDGCQSSPAELRAQLNLTGATKRKWPHLEGMYLPVTSFMLQMLNSFSGITGKRRLSQLKSTNPRSSCNTMSPQHSGQLFNTTTGDRWNYEKRPGASLYLKRITRLKIANSEIRSEDRSSYLERYSPKGSCFRDESSMGHTLAQNCRCEFSCGVHLTCKNTNN